MRKEVYAYPVIFTKTGDKKNTYLVEIPDINGFTEGFGLADAIKMARDYIGESLYNMDDKEIPSASEIEEIDVSAGEFADAGKSIVSIVDIDMEAFKRKMDNRAVRKNISLPAWLAQSVDELHINLSREVQEFLTEKYHLA